MLRSYAGGGPWPGVVKMGDLAGTSVRSLQRRLNAEGHVYSELVDQVRVELATEILENSDDSLNEIAERLGYSNPGNFSRAYHRWTGVSPNAVRKK